MIDIIFDSKTLKQMLNKSPKILLAKCMNVLIKGWGYNKFEAAHAPN